MPDADKFSKEQIVDQISKILFKVVSFEIGKENDVIKISATSKFPEQAALIANIYAETYYQRDMVNSRSNASEVRKFLEGQQELFKNELDKSENTYQSYLESEGSSALSSESNSLITKIADLESELETDDIEYQKTVLMIDNYSKELERIIPQMSQSIINVDDLYIEELQKEIAKREADRDVKKIVSSENSGRPEFQREIKRLDREIDSLKSILGNKTNDYIKASLENYTINSDGKKKKSGEIISDITGKIQELKLKLKSIEKSRELIYTTLTKYDSQFRKIPEQSVNIARLTRSKEFNEKLYLKIGEQYQEALVAEKSTFGRIDILDRAIVPDSPISPRIVVNLGFGMLLGLIFGLFAAFTLNYMFNYVRSPQDIESLGFRLISTIPKLKGENDVSRRLLSIGPDKNLLSAKGESSIAAESYQRLQIYLTYALMDRHIKSLVVSSAGPGEGKSATASNLAITLANSGKKVLLVDCDLRKPAIHKYFNLDPAPSLPHFLFNKNTLSEIIKDTHVAGLKVITSIEFAQNPALVLTSQKMQKFMDKMQREFDFVIYDSPPVNAVSDAIHLAKKVEEVILVARADKTNVDELNRANQLFAQFNIKIGGVVLNDFENSKLNSYYGRYYGYYAKDENDKKKPKVNKRNKIILQSDDFVSSKEFQNLYESAPDIEEIDFEETNGDEDILEKNENGNSNLKSNELNKDLDDV
jgi:tyrosine-protein kinase Etk/Wzc